MRKFEQVKSMVLEMGLLIVSEDPTNELVVVSDEENGIQNMIIDCEDPILIIEQLIFTRPFGVYPTAEKNIYARLLQMNRELVHGAFALCINDDGTKSILFRDTLQLENLDKNELEASIASLSLAIAEYAPELIKFSSEM